MAGLADEFATAIDDIYDAALTSGSWSGLLQRLSETLAGAGVALVVRDLKAEKSEVNDDKKSAEYQLKIKVSAPKAKAKGAEDQAPAGPAAEDDSSPPAGSVVLGCFVSRDRPFGSLVAIRPIDEDRVEAAWQRERLDMLAGHLRRGFELHNRFVTLNLQQAATKHVLDHFSVGVILADARGRVLSMNATAQAIADQQDGFTVNRSGVYADTQQETTSLRTMITEAAQPASGATGQRSGALTLTRPSMRRPFWVLVAPLRISRAEPDVGPTMVAIFISDPERRHEIPAAAFERFFGLTKAETRLLEALVNGKSLEEASEEFQVSKNTLRTQLHQIFRKTNTSRQSEVIKLVLSTPVQLEAEPG